MSIASCYDMLLLNYYVYCLIYIYSEYCLIYIYSVHSIYYNVNRILVYFSCVDGHFGKLIPHHY